MCMLNGRAVNPDDYTSFSKRGKAVVDYVWVPHEQLANWADFQVLRVSKLIDSLQVNVPDSEPDHSVLQWELYLPAHLNSLEQSVNNERLERYVTTSIHDTHIALNRTITQIEESLLREQDMNTAYEHFVNMVVTEMDKKTANQKYRSIYKEKKNYVQTLLE